VTGRVLVVEDEPNIAGIILYKLRREGHEVEHATSLAAAGALLGPWDVVLLDSSLPGEDPMSLLVEMGVRCHVAVMIESRDQTGAATAMALGAAATVRKPFKPTLLARLVLDLLATGKGDASHSAADSARGLIAPMKTPEVVA
jgi:DNA-binding response OmpR family regulator